MDIVTPNVDDSANRIEATLDGLNGGEEIADRGDCSTDNTHQVDDDLPDDPPEISVRSIDDIPEGYFSDRMDPPDYRGELQFYTLSDFECLEYLGDNLLTVQNREDGAIFTISLPVEASLPACSGHGISYYPIFNSPDLRIDSSLIGYVMTRNRRIYGFSALNGERVFIEQEGEFQIDDECTLNYLENLGLYIDPDLWVIPLLDLDSEGSIDSLGQPLDTSRILLVTEDELPLLTECARGYSSEVLPL
jgi:hypothetical protein